MSDVEALPVVAGSEAPLRSVGFLSSPSILHPWAASVSPMDSNTTSAPGIRRGTPCSKMSPTPDPPAAWVTQLLHLDAHRLLEPDA